MLVLEQGLGGTVTIEFGREGVSFGHQVLDYGSDLFRSLRRKVKMLEAQN